ncbi:MAG: hypothetical protein HY343_07435 [Lentisphaerae bacterium]|nr:hypothetical protein [Lentisphaerota bacterium]
MNLKHRFNRVGLIPVVLFLFAVLYLSLHGFPDPWSKKLLQKIQYPGTVVVLDKIKLGVFEGIIATQVRCYRKGELGQPFLEAERVVLYFNPFAWLDGETGFTGAQLKKGTFRLWLKRGEIAAAPTPADRPPQQIQISLTQASLKFEGGKTIRVVGSEGEAIGVSFSAQGVLRTGGGEPGKSAESAALAIDMAPLQASLDYFRTLEFSEPARLDIDFDADLDRPERNEAKWRLEAVGARRAPWSVGRCSVQAQSLGLTCAGNVEIQDAQALGVRMERATARFEADRTGVSIRQAQAVVGSAPWQGSVAFTGACDFAQQSFQGRVTARMAPRILAPAFKAMPRLVERLESFDFSQGPPRIEAWVKGAWKVPAWVELQGHIDAGPFSFQGGAVSKGESDFLLGLSSTNAFVRFDPLKVTREEGDVRGRLTQDILHEQMAFNLVSDVDPRVAARWIGPFMVEIVAPFSFQGPVHAAAAGVVDFADMDQTDISAVVEGRKVGLWRLVTDECAFHLQVAGERVEVDNLRGKLAGGPFEGRFTAFAAEGNSPLRYELEGTLHNADFESLMRAISRETRSTRGGKSSAHLALSGRIGEGQGKTATGEGWVKVSEGQIFQIPLFGGLSDILAKFIPGLGAMMRQTDARADIRVREGKVLSKEILVEGDVLSLNGKGVCSLAGDLDYDVQVKLLRKHTLAGDVARLVTFPVSKLLECHLGGTLGSPRWRPLRLPKELFPGSAP